jgi:hypothetical protein
MTNPLAMEALLETHCHSRMTLRIPAEPSTPLNFEYLLYTQQYRVTIKEIDTFNVIKAVSIVATQFA